MAIRFGDSNRGQRVFLEGDIVTEAMLEAMASPDGWTIVTAGTCSGCGHGLWQRIDGDVRIRRGGWHERLTLATRSISPSKTIDEQKAREQERQLLEMGAGNSEGGGLREATCAIESSNIPPLPMCPDGAFLSKFRIHVDAQSLTPYSASTTCVSPISSRPYVCRAQAFSRMDVSHASRPRRCQPQSRRRT